MSRSRQTWHPGKLNKMLPKLPWRDRINSQPSPHIGPQNTKNITMQKRWVNDSKTLQSATHMSSVGLRIPHWTRLSLVGSRLRRRHHTNKDTFDGICFDQTSSTWDLSAMTHVSVIKRYAAFTKYPWTGSNIHLQESWTVSYKTMLHKKATHSLTLSSSMQTDDFSIPTPFHYRPMENLY